MWLRCWTFEECWVKSFHWKSQITIPELQLTSSMFYCTCFLQTFGLNLQQYMLLLKLHFRWELNFLILILQSISLEHLAIELPLLVRLLGILKCLLYCWLLLIKNFSKYKFKDLKWPIKVFYKNLLPVRTSDQGLLIFVSLCLKPLKIHKQDNKQSLPFRLSNHTIPCPTIKSCYQSTVNWQAWWPCCQALPD